MWNFNFLSEIQEIEILFFYRTSHHTTLCSISIVDEYFDLCYSHDTHLTRLSVQEVIATVDHHNRIYLILTTEDITMEDFYRTICGFHYFTFSSKVGYKLPYVWVGNSEKQCPEVCIYPFIVPEYMGGGGLGHLTPPNSNVGVDNMVSVIDHELTKLSSNPLVNVWYADEDPTVPTEIEDLCEGFVRNGWWQRLYRFRYERGEGRTFNLNDRNGRKFLV